MRSTALPVSCTQDFLSHLPSFEFYGFQSLQRGKLGIKKIHNKGEDRLWGTVSSPSTACGKSVHNGEVLRIFYRVHLPDHKTGVY